MTTIGEGKTTSKGTATRARPPRFQLPYRHDTTRHDTTQTGRQATRSKARRHEERSDTAWQTRRTRHHKKATLTRPQQRTPLSPPSKQTGKQTGGQTGRQTAHPSVVMTRTERHTHRPSDRTHTAGDPMWQGTRQGTPPDCDISFVSGFAGGRQGKKPHSPPVR
jgi:hypothetical protein